MKKKMNVFIFRGLLALLPVVFWVLIIRLLASQQNHGIGFLGFLSTAAFLVFSMQWSLQSGQARELHPHLPSEPYVNLSIHTALHVFKSQVNNNLWMYQ